MHGFSLLSKISLVLLIKTSQLLELIQKCMGYCKYSEHASFGKLLLSINFVNETLQQNKKICQNVALLKDNKNAMPSIHFLSKQHKKDWTHLKVGSLNLQSYDFCPNQSVSISKQLFSLRKFKMVFKNFTKSQSS